MTDLSHAFGQNDIEDFDRHIARLLRGRNDAEREELQHFLRANPGMTVRDWKGKGPSIPLDPEPREKPWHQLRQVDVREAATTAFARELPRNLRQAAARDPSLIWSPLGKYRLRLPTDPLPGVESSEPGHLRTGAGLEFESKHGFPVGNTPVPVPAPARVSPRRRARGG